MWRPCFSKGITCLFIKYLYLKRGLISSAKKKRNRIQKWETLDLPWRYRVSGFPLSSISHSTCKNTNSVYSVLCTILQNKLLRHWVIQNGNTSSVNLWKHETSNPFSPQIYPPVSRVSKLHVQLTWNIPWMRPLKKISNYCSQDHKCEGYHVTSQEIKNKEEGKKHLMHINHKKPHIFEEEKSYYFYCRSLWNSDH